MAHHAADPGKDCRPNHPFWVQEKKSVQLYTVRLLTPGRLSASRNCTMSKLNYRQRLKLEVFYTGGAVRLSSDGKLLACACGDEVKVSVAQVETSAWRLTCMLASADLYHVLPACAGGGRGYRRRAEDAAWGEPCACAWSRRLRGSQLCCVTQRVGGRPCPPAC